MKIEKITLCNLTSIEGEHTIDFTQEPLRSASLFAITGDTGAGKSTLLDAICLALYNKAPRFENAETIAAPDLEQEAPGALRLQARDVRHMLRRGQKEGHAQVVFSTPDGARYAAGWYLRVKRTGNYDRVTRTLRCLAPRKKDFPEQEIDTAITQIIGLDYTQFTRTVMLAQNSFSNFLKARREEKSQLLEKLTGTEIYGRISQTIYQQTAQARQNYEALESELKGIFTNRLRPEELAETEERRRLRQSRLKTMEEQSRLIETQLQWYSDNQLLEQKVRLCEDAQNAAHKAYVALRGEELMLERYDDVLCVQPLYQEIAVHNADIARLKQQEEATAARILEERQHVERTRAALAEQQNRTADAEQQLNLRRPAINRGHALNGEISEANEQLRKAQLEYKEAQQRYDQLLTQLAGKKNHYRLVQKEIEETQLHHQALSVHKVMFDRYDLLKDKLSQFNTESQQNEKNQKKLAELQRMQKELGQAREKLEGVQQQNMEQLSVVKSELSIHQQANRGCDGEALQQRFADSRSRLVELEQAALLWQRISTGYLEISEKQANRNRHMAEQEQLKKDIARLQREADVLNEAYHRLNVAFTLSQSENIVQLRQQLKEGSACPVCGATHHPYHTETERELGELLNNLEKEHNEARQQLEEKRQQLQEMRERLASGEGRLHAETENLNEREQQQKDDVEKWNTFTHLDTTFADCSPSVSRDARRLMIETLLDSTRRSLEEARQELHTFNVHQQHINRLNEDAARLTFKMNEDQARLEEIRAQHQIITASIDELLHAINLSDRTCGQLYADLDGIITLSGWFSEWRNNADHFRLRLTQLNEDWKDTCKRLEECRRNEAVLGEEVRSTEANTADMSRQVAHLRDAAELATQTLAGKQQELRQLFGNGTPEQEEETLQQRIAEARSREIQARSQAETAAAAYSLSKGTHHNLVENRLKKQKEYHEKMSELDLWMLRFNGSHSPVQLAELERIFSDPRDWNALRRRIDAHRQEVVLSRHNTELARQELLRLQSAPTRPDAGKGETPEALAETAATLQQQSQELRDELAAINLKILAHERSLQVAATYEARMAAARDDFEQWSSLNALFGSADGKKFRELAQSYTFSYLVEHANRHLHQLSPRYELYTLPGTLTLEIVDHDMFDQRRYVHSLSGGETFVVSLSLALGLASLSGNSLAIGSLFIDEGFGNLDEESLQLVMDALARLENSQGRKVGVISHTQQIRSQISPQIRLVKVPGGGRSRIEIQ